MAIFDLFSKRKRALSKTTPDVYQYDVIPTPLRIQLIHIWHDSIGNPHVNFDDQTWTFYHQIANTLRREWGVLTLTKENYQPSDVRQSYPDVINRFGMEEDVDLVLDIVELCCLTIDHAVRGRNWIRGEDANDIADLAIAEVNERFREHAIGYEYSDGQLIRVDSAFAHQEIVKPVLTVLRGSRFITAQAEFLKAHTHYRKSEYSDALIECCKAFESTMKIICAKRKWTVDKNATASALVKACLDNGLVPEFWQGHIGGLKNLLESAIPTPRNKLGGHGAGAASHAVSEPLARYVLNMTASTILFLTEAEEKLK